MSERIRVVLCAASAYDKKYYFNRKFDGLPQNIKEELNILCVLFTEEIGGIFTLVFTPEGGVEMETESDEGDLLYDEIGCGLMVKKISQQKRELFESLSIYYRVKILGEDPGALLAGDDEEDGED